MSNDAAILGRALREITGKCRVCGCGGDSCNVGQGEKCVWMDALKTLCSNPRCIQAAEIVAKKIERERKQVAAKVSTVPTWLKLKRERDRKHRKKRKGRVA
jgi:hypothetical protein